MIPSDEQVDREIAAFGPGLGRMQAINRIRQRTWILEQQRRNPCIAFVGPKAQHEAPGQH